MKKLALLALMGLTMTSCWVARIYTEVPTTKPVAPVQTVYTTQVTTPSPKVTTVTTFTVTNYNTDPCFYLDLNAVAAAFAESRTVKEFEQLLNSSRYMINNLDLNKDGWVDYLRVIETHRGYYHTFLIQACLAPSVFQDVATLVAERQANVLYVEVIGDRYLYGYNYIVRPVFVKRPPLWDVFGRANYAIWTSPYHYGYFPSYYTKPKPVYLNHYQAYVSTYMTNHHYCHHCDYPSTPHYSGYTEMTQSHRRNDYAVAHPDNSFERRVTSTASASGVSVRNAAQLRTEVEKSAGTSARTSGTATATASTTSTTSSGSGRTSSGTATTSTSSTSARTTTTSTTTTSTTSARTSGTATTGTSTAVTKAPTTTRQPSTSVDTRVNKSGTTRTTVKTTDATGRTQTVKRESSSSTRSSGTSTRSSSTSSSSTSTRSSQGTKTESNPRSGQRVR